MEGIAVSQGGIRVGAELHFEIQLGPEQLAFVEADTQQDGGHFLGIETESDARLMQALGREMDLEPVSFFLRAGNTVVHLGESPCIVAEIHGSVHVIA